MPSRRRSRESALQMIYQWEMGGASPQQVVADFFGGLARDSPCPVDTFAEQLFLRVSGEVDQLDALIRRFAQHWSPERISPVVRHLLRLAISEIRSGTPAGIVINEAVDISRRFAGDESTAFVNGILDAASKDASTPGKSESAL